MMLGEKAVGSTLKARWPFTCSSKGWLSVVPRYAPLVGLAPELPLVIQKPPLLMPPSVAALTLVTLAPLPEKAPARFNPVALFVTTAVGNCAKEIVPLKLPALFANMAYGAAVNC